MAWTLIDKNGFLRLLPASVYDEIPFAMLRAFCHHHARYGLPTVELIDFLKTFIGNRKAIEIGSGAGDLAYHLGIQATDNRQQEWADVALFYQASGQPTIKYPDTIDALDALDAVAKYNPDVVIASWVTEWIDPKLPPPKHGGNMYGVKEDEIVKSGRTYVLIGNTTIHGHKKIMKMRHKVYKLPFLRSRSRYFDENRIWVWNE